MNRKMNKVYKWFSDNAIPSLLVGFVLVAIGSFVDTKNGFADLKTTIIQQNEKICANEEKIKNIKSANEAMRKEVIAEIHDLRNVIDYKFEFLIKLQQGIQIGSAKKYESEPPYSDKKEYDKEYTVIENDDNIHKVALIECP